MDNNLCLNNSFLVYLHKSLHIRYILSWYSVYYMFMLVKLYCSLMKCAEIYYMKLEEIYFLFCLLIMMICVWKNSKQMHGNGKFEIYFPFEVKVFRLLMHNRKNKFLIFRQHSNVSVWFNFWKFTTNNQSNSIVNFDLYLKCREFYWVLGMKLMENQMVL